MLKIMFAILGMCVVAAGSTARADDACTGLSGTYSVTHTGRGLYAWTKFKTELTFETGKSGLKYSTNWGVDVVANLDFELHNSTKVRPYFVNSNTNAAVGPDVYLREMELELDTLTDMKAHLVANKSDPKAAQAVDCAISRVSKEATNVRNLFINHQQIQIAGDMSGVKMVPGSDSPQAQQPSSVEGTKDVAAR